MNRPIEETRGPGDQHGQRVYAMLAAETGMTQDDIARLVERGGELHHEYREWRQRNPNWSSRKQTPQQRLCEIYAKRWPAGPNAARLALLDHLRKGWEMGR